MFCLRVSFSLILLGEEVQAEADGNVQVHEEEGGGIPILVHKLIQVI